jgi:hypothetical protein
VEYDRNASSSGIHTICLDEMNLAQVEHYFSDFMMLLEREDQHRELECFSAEFTRATCTFRDWSKIRLSPALRVVGTVNFDETTRLISDRFLDRANLIQLRPGPLPDVALSGSVSFAKATGPTVRLRDFQRWTRHDALPTRLARLVDDLRPILGQIGVPMSPRIYRALCRFVSSSKDLITPGEAFDVQFAQRVIPKIRGLVSTRQLDALDSLSALIEKSELSFSESAPLINDIRNQASSRSWLGEDE